METIQNKVDIDKLTKSITQIHGKKTACIFEFFDNCLDAKATIINFDKTSNNHIVVEDNGYGMDEKQIKKCLNGFVSGKDQREGRGFYGIGLLTALRIMVSSTGNNQLAYICSKNKGKKPHYVEANLRKLNTFEYDKLNKECFAQDLYKGYYLHSLLKKKGQGTLILIKNVEFEVLNQIVKNKAEIINKLIIRYGKVIMKNNVTFNFLGEIINKKRIIQESKKYRELKEFTMSIKANGIKATLFVKESSDPLAYYGVYLFLGDDYKGQMKFQALSMAGFGNLLKEHLCIEVVMEKDKKSLENFTLDKKTLHSNTQQNIFKKELEKEIKALLELYEQDLDMSHENEEIVAVKNEDKLTKETEEKLIVEKNDPKVTNEGNLLENLFLEKIASKFKDKILDKESSNKVLKTKKDELKLQRNYFKKRKPERIKELELAAEGMLLNFMNKYKVPENARVEFLPDKNDYSSTAEVLFSTVYKEESRERRLNNFGISLKLNNNALRHPSLSSLASLLKIEKFELDNSILDFKRIFKKVYGDSLNTKGKDLANTGCYRPLVKLIISKMKKDKASMFSLIRYCFGNGSEYIKYNVLNSKFKDSYFLGKYEKTDFDRDFWSKLDGSVKIKVKGDSNNGVLVEVEGVGNIIFRVKVESAKGEFIDNVNFKVNVEFYPTASFKNKYTSIFYFD